MPKGHSATSNDSPRFCGEFLAPSDCSNFVCPTTNFDLSLQPRFEHWSAYLLGCISFPLGLPGFHHPHICLPWDHPNQQTQPPIWTAKNLAAHHKSKILAAHHKSQKSLQFQPSLTLSLGDVSTQRKWRALVNNHDDINIFGCHHRCDGDDDTNQWWPSPSRCWAGEPDWMWSHKFATLGLPSVPHWHHWNCKVITWKMWIYSGA